MKVPLITLIDANIELGIEHTVAEHIGLHQHSQKPTLYAYLMTRFMAKAGFFAPRSVRGMAPRPA